MSQNHTDLTAPIPDDGIVELANTTTWALTCQLTKVEPTYIEVRVLPPATEGLVLNSTRRIRFATKQAVKAFWAQLPGVTPTELLKESRAGSLVLRQLRLELSCNGSELTAGIKQGLYANV